MPSLADAFDMRPLGEITLGGRSYPVPPLTFGRFQKLLSQDFSALLRALGGDPDDEVPTPFNPAPLRDIATMLIPEIDPEVWEVCAKQEHAARVFLFFARGHDWSFLLDAIAFGQPLEPGEKMPTAGRMMAGLLALSQQSGIPVDELMDKRAEGVYHVGAGVKERNDMAAEAAGEAAGPASGPPPPGLGRREEVATILDLMEQAGG